MPVSPRGVPCVHHVYVMKVGESAMRTCGGYAAHEVKATGGA